MSKHTKGPWKQLFHTSQPGKVDMMHIGIDHGESGSYTVAIIPMYGADATESNARLVTTAPEMLEALKYARAVLAATGLENQPELSEALDKMLTVIAKAEGRI